MKFSVFAQGLAKAVMRPLEFERVSAAFRGCPEKQKRVRDRRDIFFAGELSADAGAVFFTATVLRKAGWTQGRPG